MEKSEKTMVDSRVEISERRRCGQIGRGLSSVFQCVSRVWSDLSGSRRLLYPPSEPAVCLSVSQTNKRVECRVQTDAGAETSDVTRWRTRCPPGHVGGRTVSTCRRLSVARRREGCEAVDQVLRRGENNNNILINDSSFHARDFRVSLFIGLHRSKMGQIWGF